MAAPDVITLDLNFQGTPQAVAAYLVPHAEGAVLVECGPGSTVDALKAGLAAHGMSPRDISHVLLTHIHLDHAGAAGWMAAQGAKIVVHPNGAPHLTNPEKLLRSARRIYGDEMDSLWGEFLTVPEASLIVPVSGAELRIANLVIGVVDTPGHAEHHFCYRLEDLCFTGDVGGIRIPGYSFVRLPMPPPELHMEKWRQSIKTLQTLIFKRIAPTHFGIFEDASTHLKTLEAELDKTERWLEGVMRAEPDVEHLRTQLLNWAHAEDVRAGLEEEAIRAHALANPLSMSADGLFRYWHKIRHPEGA